MASLLSFAEPAVPYLVAMQDARLDFNGFPRYASTVMRLRPLVSSLSLAADLFLSYVVVSAGTHFRNLLLSEPLVGVTNAQQIFPNFLIVWLLAVCTQLLTFLPLKLVAVSLNALARVRTVGVAVAAAHLALGPQNHIGIAFVAIAQASVAADSASLGFGVVSSVVCGVALTAVHNSPLQPFVFGFLALWFIAYAIVHAFATPGKPAAAAQQNPAKKKKE